MSRYMLLDGPLRGHHLDELPDGYELSQTSGRIGIWVQTRKDFEEMEAIARLMESAEASLDAQTVVKLQNGVDLVADNEETRRAVSDFREAMNRQDQLFRRMAPDLY